MRRSVFVLLIAIVTAGAAVWSQEGPWFDTEKCAFCKNMAAQPGLLDHFQTEYYDLHNGMLWVSHIDKEFVPAFRKAQEGIEPVLKDLQAGKPVYICRHCTALGELERAGVTPDVIDDGETIYVVYTSNDSALVAKIQTFRKNCSAGVAEMMKAKAGTPEKSK